MIRLISLPFQLAAADFGSEIRARTTNCACDYIRWDGHTETHILAYHKRFAMQFDGENAFDVIIASRAPSVLRVCD